MEIRIGKKWTNTKKGKERTGNIERIIKKKKGTGYEWKWIRERQEKICQKRNHEQKTQNGKKMKKVKKKERKLQKENRKEKKRK